jgi:hypothetical protein
MGNVKRPRITEESQGDSFKPSLVESLFLRIYFCRIELRLEKDMTGLKDFRKAVWGKVKIKAPFPITIIVKT